MSTEYVVLNPAPEADQPFTIAVDESGCRFSFDIEAQLENNGNHAALWGVGLDSDDDIALRMVTTSTRITPERLVGMAMELLQAAGYHLADTRIIVQAFEAKRKEQHW